MPIRLRRTAASLPLLGSLAIALGLLAPVPASATPNRPPRVEAPGSLPAAEGLPPSEADPPSSEPETRPPRDGQSRAHADAGCHVSIEVTARQITAGDPVTVFGRLICEDGQSAADQIVDLDQREHSSGAPGFGLAGTATTEADGFYALTLPALGASSVFYVRSLGARSTRTLVKVAARVTLLGSVLGTRPFIGGGHSHARPQNTVTFTGRVTPATPGAVVALQRESAARNDEWHRVALGRVDENGGYSITHTFGIPGEANLRVVVHARGQNVAGASETLTYEIYPRQNPRLTIQASADPVSYGQAVTIRGVAAGAANQPVTLLARTPGSAPVAVAKASTDGAGNYAFVESPRQDIVYRVTDARTGSTPLQLGVKYALTAVPSADTVQAGQQLAFSGSVVPAQAGQIVYLERKNPSGLGFHVVDAGIVTGDATYSISHTFCQVGAEVLRIKVPRGSGSQGAASGSFDVDVTPTPAGALGTEGPPVSLSVDG
jgi:hypothetical protein